AKEVRHLVGAQGQPRDHAEAPAATALQGPEQVGIVAGVDGTGFAIFGDDFGFQQVGCGCTVALGPASETAAANETRDADRQATAALHVTAGPCRHRFVGVTPDLPRANADGRLRLDLAVTIRRYEGIVH